MSDSDTEKQSERNSLLAWLGGLTALITAIGGLTALFQSLDPVAAWFGFKDPETPGVDQADSEFKVDAKSPKGYRFQNTQSSPETYQFFASGRWTYNTGLGQPHGPDGYEILATDNYHLKGQPEGALIVRRENGSYELTGSREELTLEPKETVFFTINDTKDGGSYEDNNGTLTVEWSCRTCQ